MINVVTYDCSNTFEIHDPCKGIISYFDRNEMEQIILQAALHLGWTVHQPSPTHGILGVNYEN